MAQEEMDFSSKTPDELDAIIQAARSAKADQQAQSTIALIGALEASLEEVKERLGASAPKLQEIKQQWLPKPSVIARKRGLSETEMHNALEKGRKAVAGL